MDYKFEINSDEINIVRNKVMKCKIIVLDKMGKNPLMNPRYFNKTDKETLVKEVKELYDSDSIESINDKFNSICLDKIFNNYENSDIYVDKRFPEQQQKIDDEEEAFLKLKEEIKTNKLIEETI